MGINNSGNQQFNNNADGFDLSGGTTPRKITISDGDVSIIGVSGITVTFPSSNSTLATTDDISYALSNNIELGAHSIRLQQLLSHGTVLYINGKSATGTDNGGQVWISGGAGGETSGNGGKVTIYGGQALSESSGRGGDVCINLGSGIDGSGSFVIHEDESAYTPSDYNYPYFLIDAGQNSIKYDTTAWSGIVVSRGSGPSNVGVAIQGLGNTYGSNNGIGLYGSSGVNNPADTGISIGAYFKTTTTHSGGYNYAVYASSTGSSLENIAIIGTAKGVTGATYNATGIRGNGITAGTNTAAGVLGLATVTDTSDTASAYGGRFLSEDTHAGGINYGVYSSASNGGTNYAFYASTGSSSDYTFYGINGSIRTWNNIFSQNGNVYAVTGHVYATAGDIYATAGDIYATAGDIYATAGDIYATAGNVKGYNIRDRNHFYAFTDFVHLSSIEGDTWVLSAINSGTSSVGTNSGHRLGVQRFNSSTSANSGYRAMTGTASIYGIEGGEETTASLYLSNLTGTTTRFGFIDTTTSADSTDGAYIEIVDGTLVGKTANNSTRSTTSTNYSVSTSIWYRMEIIVNADASSITFNLYIAAGTSPVWSDSLTTNIPIYRSFGHGINTTNSGTSALELVNIDYLELKINTSISR